MDCGTPDFPVHHQLLELAQTHIHQVGVAIQPSHPLSSLLLLPSIPESGSFPRSQFFAKGEQSIGASASVLPMNIQDWFPLGLTGCISLQSKGLSRVSSNTTVWKHQFFNAQLSLWSNSHHTSMTTGKTIALTRQTFILLSRLVIAFLPRSKCLLISWLQSWNKQCDKIFHFSSWECCQKTLFLNKLF